MVLKKFFRVIFQTSYEDILGVIKESNCKYVSFDIFDTLIKRNISCPADIFVVLEKEFNLTFHKKCSFVNMRLQAERTARSEIQYEDVTLEEIYKYISDLSELEKAWLLRREKALELSFCQRNFVVGEVYDWCIKNMQAVYIVSDMYLPEETIVKILANAGYSDWGKLYLSSTKRKRKSTGNLFKELLVKEKIKGEEIIHIGDTIKGDYIMPKKCGMKACLIPQNVFNSKVFRCKDKKGAPLEQKVLKNFINNNIKNSKNFYKEIGYSVLGPILFGYCRWLHEQLIIKGIDKVFFLAREGRLLKDAFDILYGDEKIESHLIAVSRQATVVPLLETVESFEDVLSFIFVSRAGFTLKNLYESCELTEAEIKMIEKETHIDRNNHISELKTNEKNKIFSSAKAFIGKKAQEQKKFITGYLNNQGFYGKIAVADVGWHGTIQNALQKIFLKNTIYGFYVGRCTIKNAHAVKGAIGYLFDDNKNRTILREVTFSVRIFELFFLSTDGSTISYGYDKSRGYYPIKRKPEQTKESKCVINMLQKSALRFVNDFNKSQINDVIKISPETYYKLYKDLVNPPRLRVVGQFENFNYLAVEEEKLVAQHKMLYYLLHPTVFKNDFLNNSCKLFFLKSIFKLPFPYFKFLCFLKNFDR